MSVLIRGMGIPKTCGDCPCYEIEEGFCNVTYDDVSCLQISKQGNCPLIELPTHGRLIDADALRADYVFPSSATNTPNYRYVSIEQIENAQTVIEAEEVEE